MTGLLRAPVVEAQDRWPIEPRPYPSKPPPAIFANPFAALSPREQEVAAAVAAGRSNKEIARVLDISPWTVSSHLRQVFAKLGVARRIELSVLWHRSR
jgi:DNA-binding CsgD family transcriptional regulator